MKCSNKPECSVIWSQETDCLGNLQQEKCSFQHYFDDLNIKGFICLVTADMFTSSGCPTLPKACVVLLCSRNLAYFSSSRPPLAKDCSKGWGAYFNDLTSFAVQWQSPLDSQSLRELSLAPALMPHTCKCVLDWWMLFLQTCFYVYLVIWSRAALEILYANTLQERYSVNKSILPANNVYLHLDVLPRKRANPIDTGNIDNISLSFLKVGHRQHCQVQHGSDVGCHHPVQSWSHNNEEILWRWSSNCSRSLSPQWISSGGYFSLE